MRGKRPTSDTLKQITLCRKALQVVNDASSVGTVDAGSQPAHPAAFDGKNFSKALANLKQALNNLRIKSAVLISAVKSLGTPHQGQLCLECDSTHVHGAEPAYLAQPTGPTTLAGRKATMSTKEPAHFAGSARKLEARWITARNRLIEPKLRFVVQQLKNLACPGMPLADLIGEGNQALIEAADSFDPSKPELRNRALGKAQVAQASGTSDGDSSNFGEVGISHANIRSSR